MLLRFRLGLAIVCSAVLLGSGCAWLDSKQCSIIYRPSVGVPADFAGLRPGDEQYFLKTGSGAEQIEIWWLPHLDARAPTLLYFHGTFRNLYQNAPKINALREAGFAVLAIEYRGWGRSTAMVATPWAAV